MNLKKNLFVLSLSLIVMLASLQTAFALNKVKNKMNSFDANLRWETDAEVDVWIEGG